MKANCLICADLFDGVNSVIATPCGHVFHEICCLQWLEQSKTCPSCRHKMTMKSMVKLYFTLGEDDYSLTEDSESKLKNELEAAKADLKLKAMEKHKLFEDMDDLRKAVIAAENQADLNQQKYLQYQSQVTAARLQLKQLLKETSMMQNVSDENKRLVKQLNHLKNVQSIISECHGEVEKTLTSWGGGASSSKETATYMVLLKRELQNSCEARSKMANEVRTLKYELGLKSSQLKEAKQELEKEKASLQFLQDNLDALETTKDKHMRTPVSLKRKSTQSNKSIKENTPTPFKKPKMDRVSSVVSMVHKHPAPAVPQAKVNVSNANLFRPAKSSSQNVAAC